MGRWEPDAPARLQQAASDLYTERGYDRTTVAEIAARAGLTERTFFRYFADKREVLFDGSERFREALVTAVSAAPASASALQAVTAGVEAATSVLPARDVVSRRLAIVTGTPELQERELMKLSAVAAALATALRDRGVADLVAELAAETGVAVLRIALPRWVSDPDGRAWQHHVRQAMTELRRLTTDGAAGA